MGNEPQKQQQRVAISANINHPKFQNAKVVPEGKQKLLQTAFGVDQKQFQRWKNSLKPLNLDPAYLLLPKKQQFDRKGLCGDSGTLKLYFQNYSYLLTEEIYNRNGRKTIFEQTELWYLLLVLASAQQEVKRKAKAKVGDIRPHNVFLNSEGEAKVSCVYSWPRQNTNFSKTFDNQCTYLSPEDIAKLEKGIMEDAHSYQSEVFSIGLTLLSAGMLEDFLGLYTISSKSYKLNSRKLILLINQWRSNTVYSEILTAFISSLCSEEVENRLTDDQLWQWISQFQKQIKSKNDFFIESAPPKIQQELEKMRQLFPQGQRNQHYILPPQQTYIQFQPLKRQKQAQSESQQHLIDKSVVVQDFYPSLQHYYEHQKPAFDEHVDPSYVQTYYQPQIQTTNNAYNQRISMQKSPSGKRLVKEQYVPTLNAQPPHARNSENLLTNLTPQYRQTADAKKQAFFQRYNQVQPITTYVESSPANGRFTTPSFNYNNLQYELKQRNVIYEDPRLANYAQNNSATNEKQLPPQFIGRTINETYINKDRETRTYHQGYIPEHLTQPRGQFIPNGRVNESTSNTQGLNYFQNTTNPQGNDEERAEQTVYIQRSEYNNNFSKQ